MNIKVGKLISLNRLITVLSNRIAHKFKYSTTKDFIIYK